jgi:uncharacterized membrane protein
MEVSQILGRITAESRAQLERSWSEDGPSDVGEPAAAPVPEDDGHIVVFRTSGWLQQVATDQLLDLVPDGGTVRLDTAVGRYAVEGAPLCTLWPRPEDPDAVADRAEQAIHVGAVRTMQQDPAYGIRQLVDVALIALSPGVNDPTTAQEAIFHITDVLRDALVRGAPPGELTDDRGRRLVAPEAVSEDSLVRLGFEEIRRAAGSQPQVSIYLLEALHLLHRPMVDRGRHEVAAMLAAQAELVVAQARRGDLLPADLQQVEGAYTRRFTR